MAVREGAWDCPYCGQQRNRGPERFCGACGSPRGAEVKFYLPEDARVVEDAAELERARAGPDWTCAFCAGDNPARNAFCVGCGAGRDGSPPRAVTEHRDAPAAPASKPAGPKRSPFLLAGCLGGCGTLLLLLMILGVWLTGTRDVDLKVASVRWQRTIEVQRSMVERHEDWRDQVPSDAREISSRQDIRSHRQVQVGSESRTRTVSRQVQRGTERVKVGTRDLGNGYFEDVYEDRPVYEDVQETETYQEPVYRQEPVYDTKVAYEVTRWRTVRTAEASGTDLQPRWARLDLGPGEREGPRQEKYEVSLQDARGQTYPWSPTTEAEFMRFPIGSPWRAKIDRLGRVKQLEP